MTAYRVKETDMSAGTPNRRAALLTGGAIALALVALGQAAPAAAQIDPTRSFQGTGTSPNVSIEQTGSQDFITVFAPEAVIDWTPIDTGPGPITFLPEGSTGTFVNGSGVSDFVVLNRIVPTDTTRAIRFDGTVESRVDGSRGGSVWFYSPGGIIAGSSALFDVGSLVLTTSPIDTSGGLFGPGGEIRFGQALNSDAAVNLNFGARITATSPGSYVALVAPRIVQSGTVNVDGSIAYVGAEAATIRINGGLFDIAISTGTTGTAIDHSGVTTGPAGTSGIYMATIAKNDAVSILVSGAVGYTPASNAFFDNGTIVLAAGYNVTGGFIDADPAAANNGAANITLTARNASSSGFRSDVVARAANAMAVTIEDGLDLRFTSDAALHGDVSTTVTVPGFAQRLIVDNDLNLTAGRGGQGGIVTLQTSYEGGYGAQPADINIGGNLTVDASGFGAINFTPGGTGGNGTGGTAVVNIDQGTLRVAGSTRIAAPGIGGFGLGRSGDGTGGTARLTIGPNSTVQLNDLTLDASGSTISDNGNFGPTLVGGNARGTLAEIVMTGGDLTASFVSIGTQGSAGSGSDPDDNQAGASGGDGQGGTARIVMSGGSMDLNELSIDASGVGGFGDAAGTGGNGTGGNATVTLDNATLNVLSTTTLWSFADSGFGRISGDANAGNVSITVNQGGVYESDNANLYASASAFTGAERGGDAVGGTATLLANGGEAYLGGLTFEADARGGGGNALGGTATGGTLLLAARDGGLVDAFSSFITMSADATGGSADTGGNGTGGAITLDAAGGSLSFSTQGSLFLSAAGSGGRSFVSNPTTGQGGTITVSGRAGNSGTTALTFGNFSADTSGAIGGNEGFRGGQPGTGGLGLGGTVTTNLSTGTLDAITYTLSAIGTGGQSTPGGVAGDGEGGYVTFNQTGGTATFGSLDVSAVGIGGEGAFGDSDFAATAGGTGFGGDATVRVSSTSEAATLNAGFVTVDARGVGGNGGFAFEGNSGAGGNGEGGIALFTSEPGAIVSGSQLTVSALGQGGEGSSIFYSFDTEVHDIGGDGGDGLGGDAQIRIAGTDTQFNVVEVSAIGAGGKGADLETGYGSFDPASTGRAGSGGSGTGGSAQLLFTGNATVATGLSAIADGNGGTAGTGPTGGNGGDGNGGAATLTVQNAVVNLTGARASAQGNGAAGGDSATGIGGNGGAATGGTARIEAAGAATALTHANYQINANGTGGIGGAGGFAPSGGAGGNGGAGAGGTAELRANLATMTLISGEGGLNSLFALGFGGGGGAGGNAYSSGPGTGGAGGAGADGTGGTARVASVGGVISAGNFEAIANGQFGQGGAGGLDGGGAPAAAGADGIGAGGVAALQAQDGPSGQLGGIRLGNTLLQAEGVDNNGAATGISGRIAIDDSGADPAGSIRLNALTARARGTSTDTGSGFHFASSAGPVIVTQFVDVSTNGPIVIAAQGSGGLQAGGPVSLAGDQAITITHGGQPTGGTPFDTLRAANLTALTNGAFLAGPGSVVRTTGSMSIAAGGNVTGTGAQFIAGGAIDATAGGDINFSRISAGDTVVLTANDGDVVVSDDLVAANGAQAFGETVDLNAANALIVDVARSTVGDIRIESRNGDLSLGLIDARTNVVARSGGTLFVQGGVAGNQVSLQSVDIEIGDSAQVGQYDRTTRVAFVNGGTRTSFIGGAGTGSPPGYRLSNAELQRVASNGDLAISGTTDAVLDTLSLTAGSQSFGNFGPAGRFSIQTPGAIDVIGAAVFNGMGADTTVALTAGGDIRVAAESGSVALRNANGGLSGTLLLSGDRIIAASSAARADIATGTMAAINTRLGTNDGPASDDGYFSANTIRATVTRAFFIQNSGVNSTSRDDRRGVTVGTGGLEIGSSGSAPIQLVVNGRQLNSSGGFTTGIPFLQQIGFTSGTTLDSGSTANDCRFSKAPDCDAPDVPEIIPEIDSVRDVIENVTPRDDVGAPNGGSIFPSTLIQIVDFTPTGIEPVVDEPVTGSGNEDLWLGQGAEPKGN